MKEIITLSNGKRVANFSSPHPFTFTDGSVLPAVSEEEAERLKVTFIEKVDESNGDVELSFDLSQDIMDEARYWEKEHKEGRVDVVFCPLPMITAIKNLSSLLTLKISPFRAIRMENRISKLVSINKQCL
jgi:hypothetical protein